MRKMIGQGGRKDNAARNATLSVAAPGFTVVELAIGAVTFSTIFLALLLVLDTNQANFTRGATTVNLQQNVRVGFDDFIRDLRLAGYGVPSATKKADNSVTPLLPIFCEGTSCPAVTPFPACGGTGSTSASTVAFMADLENASTTVTVKATTSNQLKVASVAKFTQAGTPTPPPDYIFITDGDTWDAATITSVDAPNLTITFTPNTTVNKLYAAGTFVGRPRCIRYQVGTDPVTGRTILQRDASDNRGWQRISDNVQSMTLSYYDLNNLLISPGDLATNTPNIRRVTASLSGTVTPTGQSVLDFTLEGDIRPRNMR
jgi:Tfp pilus assembly protein PilW